MTRYWNIVPAPLRIVLSGLAMLGVCLLVGIGLAWREGPKLEITGEHRVAQFQLSGDRPLAIWPFCEKVTWKASQVSQIVLNDRLVAAQGTASLCSSTRADFHVMFGNRSKADYVLAWNDVGEPYVLASLIGSLLVALLRPLVVRKRPSALAWILVAFGLTGLLFFVIPVFMNPAGMVFPHDILDTNIFARDLRQIMRFSQVWVSGGTPYDLGNNNYPPLEALAFVPLIAAPLLTAYFTVTMLTLAAFCLIGLWFPFKESGRPDLSALLCLLFVTGISSYGLRFEIERGQFNIIAVAFCFAAIYLRFHHPKLRWLAYAAFVVSVQLKLYPLIFIVALVVDWSSWKRVAALIGGLLAANLAALFALGPGVFNRFVNALNDSQSQVTPNSVNGSAAAFSTKLAYLGLVSSQAIGPLTVALLGLYAICFALVLWRACRRNTGRPDPYLLLACSVGACVIPWISYDYKLPILVPAVALVLNANAGRSAESAPRWLWRYILVFVIALCYSSTIYSYVTRTGLFESTVPANLVMLIAATALAFFPDEPPTAVTSAQPADPPPGAALAAGEPG